MFEKVMKPRLAGKLVDLIPYVRESEAWRIRESGVIGQAFRDVGGDKEFRIPAADTGKEVFFNNIEMLKRFSKIPLPTQTALLQAIRAAMDIAQIDEMELEIPWSNSTKLVRVTRFGAGSDQGYLNIYV